METIFRAVRQNSNNATPLWRPTQATAMNLRSAILRTGMRPKKTAIPKEGLWWQSMIGRNRTFSCPHWRQFRSTEQAYGWVTMIWPRKEPSHGSQVLIFKPYIRKYSWKHISSITSPIIIVFHWCEQDRFMLCIVNTCIWHIGETSTFTFWAPGQPHSHHKRRFILDSVSDEDCVLLKYSDSGHWHDYPCQKLDPLGIVKEHFPYVCEYGKSIKLVMTIEIPPTISSELVNIYI